MSTVIIGSGIIGASIAYYLSEESSDTQPSEIHLVESSPELFASASGYAGGFLARDVSFYFAIKVYPDYVRLVELAFIQASEATLSFLRECFYANFRSTSGSLQLLHLSVH